MLKETENKDNPDGPKGVSKTEKTFRKFHSPSEALHTKLSTAAVLAQVNGVQRGTVQQCRFSVLTHTYT